MTIITFIRTVFNYSSIIHFLGFINFEGNIFIKISSYKIFEAFVKIIRNLCLYIKFVLKITLTYRVKLLFNLVDIKRICLVLWCWWIILFFNLIVWYQHTFHLISNFILFVCYFLTTYQLRLRKNFAVILNFFLFYHIIFWNHCVQLICAFQI